METVKFKKQLMYDNQELAEKQLIDLGKGANGLNDTLQRVESFLSEKLTIEQRKDFVKLGFDGLMRVVRKKFPHPSGSDQINLDLLGMDPRPLQVPLNTLKQRFASGDFVLDKSGKVAISKEGKTKIVERNRRYTTNQRQNEALQLAKELCDFLNANVGRIQSFTPHASVNNICHDLVEKMDLIYVEKDENSNVVLVPNSMKIGRL